MKYTLTIAFVLFSTIASLACVVPSQVVNSQRWVHVDQPIISKYIQTPKSASIIAYQRNTSHAVEFEMVKGCWTGVLQVISVASFRSLFGAKAYDEFINGKDI